jgi:type I restriction enzyme S subunit
MERYELPEGWEWKSLDDKEILTGIQPGFACGIKDVINGIPHLRMNNISKEGFLDMSLIRRIPRDKAEKSNKWLEPGDVIFNNTNSTELVGKTCMYPSWKERCTFSNHLTRLRCNTKVLSSEWLYICLRTLWISGYFATNCIEFVGQSAFNTDKLKEVEIPVPPLPEQRRIVARIEELTRRVEEARNLRQQAIFKIISFIPSLLDNLFKLAESKGWLKAKLGDKTISTIIMGQSPKGSSYNQAGVGLPLLNVPTEFGSKYPTPVQWTTEPTRLCQEGDILFCVRGSTTGRMNWSDREYCIGRGLAAIRPNQDNCLPSFLFAFVQTQSTVILHHGEGGVFPNFNKDQLSSMEIPLPPIDEQHQIVSFLNTLQSKAEELRRLQDETESELATFTPALLDKAFRGEL